MADPYWTRVRDKQTGDHYSVHVVNPKRHIPLKQPGADAFGRPLRAKPNINTGPSPESAATREESA
jgi:hypothetical protein